MIEQTATRLRDYPYKTVRLACRTCDRQERFNKDKLIAAHGDDITMLDLQSRIAACDHRRGARVPCGAFYPDLIVD
jgi:hypothetical protein